MMPMHHLSRFAYSKPIMLAGGLFLGVSAGNAHAAKLPAGFSETKLVGSVNATCMEIAPDGRIFLCDKSGRILVYKHDALLPKPLLTVEADFQEERGLLGLALDPDFAANPYVYIYYCAKNPIHNRISRFKVKGDTVTGEEQVLVELPTHGPLRAGGFHNGGSTHFGPDGKLYVTVGINFDGKTSQQMNTLFGKILRLNADGSIPEDNPYYKSATGNLRMIWALGIRNPFSSAIHPVTGKYIINDVGDANWEELSEAKSGYNLGYPNTEGHASAAPTGLLGTYSDPYVFYSHGEGCAITGANFYHPEANTFGPEYLDRFFFSDYCGGWIRTVDFNRGNAVSTFATGILRPIFMKTGKDGSLYYIARGARAANLVPGSAKDNMSTEDGVLYRITGPQATRAVTHRKTGRMVPPAFAAGRLRLPAGKTHVRLYTLSGALAWEYRAQAPAVAREGDWITLPAKLAVGALEARFD